MVGVHISPKFVLASVVASALLGLVGTPALAATPPVSQLTPAELATAPQVSQLTPAELIGEFSDSQPIAIHLTGNGDGTLSQALHLPNASAVAALLANPNLTAQQHAALGSIPTQVELTVNVTGTSGSDPVADAYMIGYDVWGNKIFKFEANLGWNESNGIVTGVSQPNFDGTYWNSPWSQTTAPSYSYPFDPTGSTEFDANYTTAGSYDIWTDNVQMDTTYKATGEWGCYGYINGQETYIDNEPMN